MKSFVLPSLQAAFGSSLAVLAPIGTYATSDPVVSYKTIEIDDVEVFYRQAGDPENPGILLLHGFPTSSHMFRNLIPELAGDYYVIAPDYPGFGHSDMPSRDDFEYTFDNYADLVEKLTVTLDFDSYALYLMDYGAPVGYRIAERSPEKVTGLIIQNGNAYEEGLREFWDPIRDLWADPNDENRDALRKFLEIEATEWQYTHGTRNPESISPDNWIVDQWFLDRPGNQEIQLDLFYDYRTNVPLYPVWQEYFRIYEPPALIVWGRNDYIFPAEGAHPYLKDLPDAEFHLLNTGHFALDEDGEFIAEQIRSFMERTTDE